MPDTKVSALTAATSLAGTDSFYVVVGGVSMRLTFSQLRALLGTETSKVVSSTQSNSTVTPAAITALSGDALVAGTYTYKASLLWQSAATTTGMTAYVRGNGGTVTKNVGHHYTTTTGTTATTGVADQATVASTFQTLESRAWRANDTNPGPYGGVDTANADQFSVIEGVIVVTATLTSFDVMFASEVAASAVTIQPGSTFVYEKVA
jgi:hypothetical protein